MKKIFFSIVILSIFSCEEIVEIEDISGERLRLLAPTDNSILDTTAVHFYWEPIPEDSVYYQIQIATPTFDNAVQIVLDSMLIPNELSATLDEKPYEWRVRAINSGYETAYSTNSFVIAEE